MTHLKTGDVAPNIKLPSHLGKEFDLAKERGKTVVVVFFPLAWTPI